MCYTNPETAPYTTRRLGEGAGNVHRPIGQNRVSWLGPHGVRRLRGCPDAVRASDYLQTVLLNELTDGAEVDQVLLVRQSERRARRDGGDFLRLQLGDRTGSVIAMVWEDLAAIEEIAPAGSPVHVSGRYVVHPRFGPQINIRSLSLAREGSYTPADLLDGPPRAPEQMEADLRQLIATVRDPHLSELLERVFGEESSLWRGYRTAPAAKHYHQAYRHGLLEHCLGVAQAVGAISATFPGIDRDVAVTGALLHDIGKLEAYTDLGGSEQVIDLTDLGRLHGEIALGYYRIRREIEQIDGFPRELGWAVLHIILSHHGSLEHGSPVTPSTREAMLVHMIDNLGGKLGSFDRIEKELAPGASWSGFDRGIGAGAWFGMRPGDPEQSLAREAA